MMGVARAAAPYGNSDDPCPATATAPAAAVAARSRRRVVHGKSDSTTVLLMWVPAFGRFDSRDVGRRGRVAIGPRCRLRLGIGSGLRPIRKCNWRPDRRAPISI